MSATIPTTPTSNLSDLYQDKIVAAHVCAKLRRGDIKIGLGLVDRYRDRIEEALSLYGEPAEDPAYLATVVVEDFRAEAHHRFGNIPQIVAVVPPTEDPLAARVRDFTERVA